MSFTCQDCKQNNLLNSQIIEVFGRHGEHRFLCLSCSIKFTFNRKGTKIITSKRRNINSLITNPAVPIEW